MSLSSSLFSGVSGLNTLGKSMGVIGDNIANVNTIGFKSARTTFETVLAQNIAAASGISQIGRGVALSAVDPVFSQGSFESTNEPTDMAIGGKGFFMVRSLQTGMFYTRAGHFSFDENGYLVNPAGLRVQGWILAPDSTDPRGAIDDIIIDATSSEPNATSEMDFAINLNSEAKFVGTPATVKSTEETRSGFAFYDGVNDSFQFTTDDGSVTVDLIQAVNTIFEEGRIYTGQEVAQALQKVINDNSTNKDYTVNYSSTTNKFTLVSGATNLILESASSTMLDVLGFPSGADTTITTATGTGSETAYNITTENNTFTIAVDGNNTVTVVLNDGIYSIVDLRREIEDSINSALAADGQSVKVDVRYDFQNNKFQISSDSRGGTTSRIKIAALEGSTNNFLPSIQMTDYTLKLGETSGSYTYPGFTESKEANPNRFLIQAGVNDDIDIGGTQYTINPGLYTGEELAAATQTVLPANILVSYDNITGRFELTNNTGAPVTVNWTDPVSTAAETLGFTADDTIAVGGTERSDNKVEFNIISGQNDQLDIIVNGNPAMSGVPVVVTVDPGAYTGENLALEIQDKINTALASAGESETVDVTWDNVSKRMRIASSALNSASSIQLNSSLGIGTNDLVGGTLQIDDDTINYATGFQLNNPDDSSNYSTSLVVYDSLGMQHVVTMYLRKALTADDLSTTWEWFAYVPADDTASGETEIQARGRLTFNSQGILTGESPTEWLTKKADGTEGEGFDFGSGAAPQQEVDIKFGLEEGVNMSTQFSAPSSTIFQTQDGYASGYLQEVSVDPDGVISGHYSNGKVLNLAKVALANFTNPWGLSREGGNLFSETNVSGQPTTGQAGTAGLGKIAPNSLEQSNVDLSAEFVAMIIQQRGFQANSRIITTTDSMLQEIVNLKR